MKIFKKLIVVFLLVSISNPAYATPYRMVDESVLKIKDGNVGVGTQAPRSSLDVVGATSTGALSVGGVAQVQQTFDLTPRMISFFQMEDATGTVLTDSMGNHNCTFSTDASSMTTTGLISNGVAFVSPRRIVCPDVADFKPNGPFFRGGWINSTSTAAQSPAGNRSATVPNRGWRVAINTTSGKLNAYLDTGSPAASVTSSITVNDGIWHMWMVQFTGDQWILYVDKVEQGRQNISLEVGGDMGTSGPTYFGFSEITNVSNYVGKEDNNYVGSGIITQTEIDYLYNSRAGTNSLSFSTGASAAKAAIKGSGTTTDLAVQVTNSADVVHLSLTDSGLLELKGDETRIWTGVGSDNNALSSGELYVENDLEVDGTVYMGSCSGAGCGGGGSGTVSSGLAGYLSYYPSTGTTVDDQNVIYTNGTNIGIGTTTPINKLGISGNMAIGAGYAGIASAPTNGLLIQGNSAIGTTSVTGAFNVVGDEARVWTGAGSDTNALSSGELYVEGDVEVDGTLYLASCSGAGCGGGANGWTDGGTNVYMTTTSDNIGIGTINPQAKLDVRGDLYVTGAMQSGGTGDSFLNYASGNLGVGIPTTTPPTGRLDVQGDEVRIWAGSGSDNNALSSGELYVQNDLEVDGTLYIASCSGAGCSSGGTISDTAYGVGWDGDTTNGASKNAIYDKIETVTASGGGWTDGGTNIYNTTSTDSVAIGTTAATGILDVRGDEARIWTGAGSDNRALSSGELYVEGDLEVDGSSLFTGNVGIGTFTPTALLNLYGSTVEERITAVGSATPTLRLERAAAGTTAVSVNDSTGSIVARGHDGTQLINSAQIAFGVDGTPGTNDMPGRITFSTTLDGAATLTERMRLENTGNLGIGTTSPIGKLNVVGDEVRIWTSAGSDNNALSSGELYVQGDLETDGTLYASSMVSTALPISGSASQVGTATTTFTVTIGSTMSNSTYKVNVTPTAALSAALFYVTNKTTTTFDVVYLAGLTGTVTFDWAVFP